MQTNRSPLLLYPPKVEVSKAVGLALAEDIGPLGDLTAALLPPSVQTTARIVARSSGILAGTACAQETFLQIDSDLSLSWLVEEGEQLSAGQTIAIVSGGLASMCTAERVALNFLSHLSGIATHTRRFVDKAAGRVAIFDTRKTTPGLRSLEKAAVRAGGGCSHRSGLSDWVMLKDNHLSVLQIPAAVQLARQHWPARKVQVECDSVEQATQALDSGADALLLDNMSPEAVAQVVDYATRPQAVASSQSASTPPFAPPYLEASGGITLDNISDYLDLGLDAISSGSLVGGAHALDIGLDIA